MSRVQPLLAENEPGTAGNPLDAVIVGGGLSGILTGIRLKQSGFERFVILEKSAGVGGTWRDNTYPGAGCDVPSHLYSFSFALNPNWSQRFATQQEILQYLEDCTTRFGVRPHLRLGCEVQRADYLAEAGLWVVQTTAGTEYIARNLVMAIGQLNRPKFPELPGRDQFRGKEFHSARWPQNYDLTGKRVVVLGTGASAIQFIPAIAPQVAALTVLQRTPNWIAPRRERPYTAAQKSRFARWPWWMRLVRWGHYLRYEVRVHAIRREPIAEYYIRQLTRRYMREQIPDSQLRQALTPDFQIGCNRVLISDDFYQTLNRPNVELLAEGAASFCDEGIVTTSGRKIPADVVVYGTGFIMHELAGPIPITGVKETLQAAWGDEPKAHFGITAPGFPNLFHLYGPNTNLGHNSIVFMVECQVEYILQLLQAKQKLGATTVEVKAEAVRQFDEWLQEDLKQTIWQGECGRPFQSKSGRVVRNWSRYTIYYWRKTRHPKLDDFEFTSPCPARSSTTGDCGVNDSDIGKSLTPQSTGVAPVTGAS